MEKEHVPAAPNESGPPASVEEIQRGWNELKLRVQQLEAERGLLEQEVKALQQLLERVVEHRQKSHGELVLILTALVSKLPLNDVGVIVSKLVEHNTNVSQMLANLIKGTVDATAPQPTILRDLEQHRREVVAAVKPQVEELIKLEAPFESDMLEALIEDPERFFSPRMVRANRGFIKGQIPRERVIREFGAEALVFFKDMTTDPKLNPNPKPEEISVAFRNDFEALLQQNPAAAGQKKQELQLLHQRVQRSKAATEQARSQKNAFQQLSFLIELLHYYDNQSTEAVDVIFAQRLPALVEQLAVAGPQDPLDEKLIVRAETLLTHVINPDHRLMIINNVGKSGGMAKTLKYVMRFRGEKLGDPHQLIAEFVKHLVPPSQKPPPPASIAAVLRLISLPMQRMVVKAIMAYERLRRQEAEALGRAVAVELGLKGLDEELKAQEAVSPEKERQIAWARIKEYISQRTDPASIAGAIRDRLNARYDADEIRQSWITLTEADPMSLIRIFCQLPYLASGKTDPIAKTVLETYVTRLTHEKYAATYQKVVTSLKNMFHAKPDSPTLLNFLALVRWASPEGADKLSADVGIPVPAH